MSHSASQHATPAQQLQALLQSAAIAPLDNLGWLRITGEDRVRWLNGMVTNSIQALAPGEGNYNFVLSAQGRIQGDATAWVLEDSILLETQSEAVPILTTLLDRFIIMDDVELAGLENRAGLLLVGPQASGLLQQLGLADLPELSMQSVPWNGADLAVVHAHSPLVPRYELWANIAAITAIKSSLTSAPAVDSEALNALRILEGTPLYGTDIRDKELPQETNQTRALHFNKGCYLGQEIVERIRSRGNVHRTFTAFRLEGELPAPGTLLEVEGKQVGELTSVATIPLPGGPIQLALGYLRREAIERRLPITYPGGTATPVSTPYANSSK